MLGIGVPANKFYPGYYQRRLGLVPFEQISAPSASIQKDSSTSVTSAPLTQKEGTPMENRFTIVAVNGSPHAGIGNTALMLEMLRQPLIDQGCALEVVTLCEHEIEYCTGCALCMEKGKCWIPDDHHAIVERLLGADGVILASPVYFFHVTAQMKTFLDRSLAWGHKPTPSWKPGLAVSVSAGSGETQTADYLAMLLRVYGAFPVGRLTAMAATPGAFVGREAVEAHARNLGRDLAQAVREKRRYPASDEDLRFYQFMSGLVRSQKDTLMQADYAHWEKHGLFEGFERYIQQTTSKADYDPEVRKAWIQEAIAAHKARREVRNAPAPKPPSPGRQSPVSCRDLIRSMPLGFRAEAAAGLEAVYQFEITGTETFVAHLRIREGRCTWHEGPVEHPDILIRSPADVWLAISRGALDGQHAFMSGQFTAQGEFGLLMKLKSLFAVG
jgi:multimeric flavodoxin WrbA/putative sterol carrier protein